MVASTFGDKVLLIDYKKRHITATLSAQRKLMFNPAIVWTKEGDRLLTTQTDGRVTEWDVASGTEVRSKRIPGLHFSGDRIGADGMVVASLDGPFLVLFDPANFDLAKSDKPINSGADGTLSYSLNAKRLAYVLPPAGTRARQVVVRDLLKREDILSIGIPEPVWCVGLDNSGDRLFVGMNRGLVKVYNLKIGAWENSLTLPIGDTGSFAMSPDGRYLLVTGWIRAAALLQATSNGWSRVRLFKNCVSNATQFSPNSKQLISQYGPQMRMYDLSKGMLVRERLLPASWLFTAQTSIREDGELWLADNTNLYGLNALDDHSKMKHLMALSRTDRIDRLGHRVVAKYVGKELRVVGRNGSVISEAPSSISENGAPWMNASADGRWVAAMVNTRKALLIDTRTGKQRSITFDLPLRYLLFSRESDRLLAVTIGSLRIYSLNSLQMVFENQLSEGVTLGASLSPDGKRIAFATTIDSVIIQNLSDGKDRLALRGHSQGVYVASWSPDGKRLVTGSEDKSIRIWDTATGQELGIVGTHPANVVEVVFLEDGHTLASLSGDGTLKVWRTRPPLTGN